MTRLFETLGDFYNYVNYDLMDPRSMDVYYVRSPLPWMITVGLYVYFVKVWGPNMMKNREPFKVEGIMKIYNVTQILFNLYLFTMAIRVVTNKDFDWRCMPVLYDTEEFSLLCLRGAYYYFWLKVYDLLDTVFFILRKKNNQVTFLHVYHHAMMVFGSWMAIKYLPGGNPTILGLINVVVHAIMYTYYLLTAIDSSYGKSIWWKKNLTQLQMLQFLVVAVHTSQVLFRNPCGYPKVLAGMLVAQNLFVFSLFYDFYRKAYGQKKTT